MDKVFKALADASRRQLLDQLRSANGQTLGRLCKHLDMTRQAVTKHLKLLEAAGLVVTVWRGREKLHYLNPVPIQEIADRLWAGKTDGAYAYRSLLDSGAVVANGSDAPIEERARAGDELAALGDTRATRIDRVTIPAGPFAFSRAGVVHVSAFEIDRHPVTVGAFAEFIEAGGYRDASLWTRRGWAWRTRETVTSPRFWGEAEWAAYLVPNHPVVGVSAYEAEAYATFRGARLPTEAELVTVDDVAQLLERAYRRFEELRPTLTPDRLDTLLTLHAIGRSFTLPRWAILRHIVNHSSYHRGQVASKLKRFGIEQSITDFFWWMIEQIPQGA